MLTAWILTLTIPNGSGLPKMKISYAMFLVGNISFTQVGGPFPASAFGTGIPTHRLWVWESLKDANTLNLPYCFSRFSNRQYDEGGGTG